MILPMIDVPVSLIGTFAVMSAMGFSLNNLTLFGLVLAIGIVVDDAIVVLENIERQIATGLDARTATIKAMEEITGPVLAITLVLSAVFIPCCFLGGITGQFFRQFAVTIAVSTIILAINALTMTPSRAVLIFKADDKNPGHEHRKEALPWWIFGLIGGIVTYWFGPDLLARWFEFPAANGDESEITDWLQTGLEFFYFFTPGAAAGCVLGWFSIEPVNAGLGWFFRGFNHYFDRMTAGYGSAVGKSLRISIILLLAYGCLLAFTYFEFNSTPTGFIPEQDKGYLIVNVQLPESASVERTIEIMEQIERITLGDELLHKRSGKPLPKPGETKYDGVPGVNHTLGIAGRSIILNANAPNLGAMYVMLKRFDKRRSLKLSADAIAQEIQNRCKQEVSEAIVKVFTAPPVDGLGTTGGFNLVIQGRGNVKLDDLEAVTKTIVENGNQTDGLEGLFNSSGADTPWVYRTSIEPSAELWDFKFPTSSTRSRSISAPITSITSTNLAEPGRSTSRPIRSSAISSPIF